MAVKGNASKRYPNSDEYNEAFGKIAENHINNKSNPHGTTPSQIGAAEKEHVHDVATAEKGGFLSPELLSVLLASVNREALDKILESYYDIAGIKAGYYDRTEVNALIDGVRVIVDHEYNKNGDNAQSGKAVAQAITQEVSKVINSSPEALNTLSELAKALGNDPNFATTVMTEIGKKANADDVYSKAIMDSKLAGKVGIGEVLTPSETEAMFLRYNSQVHTEVDHKIAVSEANIDKKMADNQTVVTGLKGAAETAASEAKEAKIEAEALVDEANARFDNIYSKDETFSKSEVTSAIAEAVAKLVDSSPETLDTLKEVAAALGDDPNFATTIMSLLGEKANSKDVYTTAQMDAKIEDAIKGKANTADVEAALKEKANAEDVYSKDETGELLGKKADKNEVSNALIGRASGEVVQISDVSPVGHGMRVKVKSDNLLPYPYRQSSSEANGTTFTAQDDGGIKLSGTPTDYVKLDLYNGICLETEKAITVSLQGEFSNVVFDLAFFDTNSRTVGAFSSTSRGGNTVTVNTKEYPTAVRWVFSIKRESNNVEMTGVVYPKVEIGETSTEYKPYVNTSGVSLIRCGKNLIPYPYPNFSYAANAGITATMLDDGGILINGTATADVFINLVRTVRYSNADILPNSTNGLITNGNINSVYCRYDATNTTAYVYVKSGTVCDNVVFYPQLEIGSVSTEYEKGIAHEVYTPDENGNIEIPSAYPVVSLFTGVDGAVIEAEYNKDLNKVFGDIDKALDAILYIQQQYLPAEALEAVSDEVSEGGDVT